MGRNQVRLQVTATTSSHNSTQDDIDEALWKDLHDQIEALTRDPRYSSINPMVS